MHHLPLGLWLLSWRQPGSKQHFLIYTFESQPLWDHEVVFFGGVLHKTKLCQAAMAHSRQARSFVLSTQVNSGRQYWNILNPQAKNWQVARGNLLCFLKKERKHDPTKANPLQHFSWYRPFKVLVQAVWLGRLDSSNEKNQMTLFGMSITVQLNFIENCW